MLILWHVLARGQDVVYPALNQKAMTFVGGGAANFQQWVDFLGTVKDKRVPPAGSPFQMNFPPEQEAPRGYTPINSSLPSCWSSELRCSCGDCPDGPQCAPVHPLTPPLLLISSCRLWLLPPVIDGKAVLSPRTSHLHAPCPLMQWRMCGSGMRTAPHRTAVVNQGMELR